MRVAYGDVRPLKKCSNPAQYAIPLRLRQTARWSAAIDLGFWFHQTKVSDWVWRRCRACMTSPRPVLERATKTMFAATVYQATGTPSSDMRPRDKLSLG